MSQTKDDASHKQGTGHVPTVQDLKRERPNDKGKSKVEVVEAPVPDNGVQGQEAIPTSQQTQTLPATAKNRKKRRRTRKTPRPGAQRFSDYDAPYFARADADYDNGFNEAFYGNDMEFWSQYRGKDW